MAKGKRRNKPKHWDVFCPNEKCSKYGKKGLGNIVSNGTYATKSGRVRKFICRDCGRVFCERTGGVFYGLRTEEKKVLLALKMLAKGMSLRGTAEVLEVKLDTVRYWLRLAASQSERVTELLVKDLKVKKVELDELWSFVKKNALHQRSYQIRANAGSG